MCKVFFFVALRWAPRPFGGARATKKHHPGCFFLLRPRGKAGEGEAPCRHGARAKKKTPPRVLFFGCGPGERQGKEKPRWLWPRAGAQRGFSFPCLSPGPEQKKNTLGGVFFFALAPCRRPTGLLLPLPFAGAAAKKKKNTPWVVLFFCSGPVPARGFSFPCLSPGPEQKKTPWVVIFFCCGPPRTRPGWCCFFCCGPARTLTHSLWAGAISARPGWFFLFLLRPRRVFLDNNKKCLGYYIGSKKTRRGHSKKKTPLPIC